MDWGKIAFALIPIGLGALVTQAWQNSHTLAAISHSIDTVGQRFERDEKELDHLRQLIEARLLSCVPRGNSDDGRK